MKLNSSDKSKFNSAGFHAVVDQSFDRTLSIDRLLVKHPAATYFFRVSGRDMFDRGVLDGDLLVIDRSVDAGLGDLLILNSEGEFKVGELVSKTPLRYMSGGKVVSPDDLEMKEWGVVCGVVRQLRHSNQTI